MSFKWIGWIGNLNRSSFPTVRPEDKCVESSHVPEVVELGHVGKHVVEVVGVRGVLALSPPSINRLQVTDR